MREYIKIWRLNLIPRIILFYACKRFTIVINARSSRTHVGEKSLKLPRWLDPRACIGRRHAKGCIKSSALNPAFYALVPRMSVYIFIVDRGSSTSGLQKEAGTRNILPQWARESRATSIIVRQIHHYRGRNATGMQWPSLRRIFRIFLSFSFLFARKLASYLRQDAVLQLAQNVSDAPLFFFLLIYFFFWFRSTAGEFEGRSGIADRGWISLRFWTSEPHAPQERSQLTSMFTKLGSNLDQSVLYPYFVRSRAILVARVL